ncbi:MAG: phosphatase domain-containing protein [Chryseolinea sp.]
MSARVPILLSYYALSNGKEALVFGQVSSTRINDLSFTDYSRRRTFRTLLSLYRTHAIANETITLSYDTLQFKTNTDISGFFLSRVNIESITGVLKKVTLANGQNVDLHHGQYALSMHEVNTPRIVISDIDDTVLHSYISRKLLKFRTLLFTPIEKRKAVEPVKQLILSFVRKGATPVYLSNSEQNLYPLIYRFLIHHGFPAGPLFLKQMRKLRDVIRYRKLPSPEIHKMKMIDFIVPLFPDKKFVLIGDNTQFDLAIYIAAAKKYPGVVDEIFIRRVIPIRNEKKIISELEALLRKLSIKFHYSEAFDQ